LPLNVPDEIHTYQIIVSIDYVWEGKAAPWYGQPGGGTQYLLPYTIECLRQLELITPLD
jgi:filamentous hemagglutinin